ncbi:MAG: amidohydrolase family protein [Acidimicrobiia bacterium]
MTVVDIDSHVYEPEFLWEDYVPKEYQAAARAALWHGFDDDGHRLTIRNGAPVQELGRSRLIREAIWYPGTTPSDIGGLDPNVFHDPNAGAWDAEMRLHDMDAMGVDQAVLHPTLFAEHLPLVANPDVAAVLARAYNDWVWDFAQAAPNRLHPAAVLPLQSVLLARRELDRAAERGFRSVSIRPMFYAREPNASMNGSAGGSAFMAYDHPTGGVFVTDAHFLPLWRQLDSLGLVACVHPSLGITNPEPTSAGSFVERVSARLGIGHTVAEPTALFQDNATFLTATLFTGLLEDMPTLKLALLHSGASWLPLVLEKAETYLWLSIPGVLNPPENPVSLEPEDVIAEHPLLLSFDAWETPVARLVDEIAAKAAFGSRYPNHDTSTSAEARSMLGGNGIDQKTADALMGGNAAALFGIAARV